MTHSTISSRGTRRTLTIEVTKMAQKRLPAGILAGRRLGLFPRIWI